MSKIPINGFEVPRKALEMYQRERMTWTQVTADAMANHYDAIDNKEYAKKSGFAIIYEGEPDTLFLLHQNW